MTSPFEPIARAAAGLLPASSPEALRETVAFFLAEVPLILALVAVVSWVAGFLRHLLPMDRFRAALETPAGRWLAYPAASLFGALTPFCSCSSVPLFIGFRSAGIPLGVSLAFLVTSPIVNEIALALLAATFGLKIALLYLAGGMALGITAGLVLGRLFRDVPAPEPSRCCGRGCGCGSETVAVPATAVGSAVDAAGAEMLRILRTTGPWIVLAVALGAALHGWVPEDFFARHLAGSSWWSVPLATVLGVPLYGSCSGVIPVLAVLVDKGVPLGTGMAFVLAVSGLSLPEGVMLFQVMGARMLAAFFGVVACGIVLLGWAFNAL